jgi:hypothetical protein
MKHKVEELEGELLDAAVAQADGADYPRLVEHCQLAAGVKWSPSTDWQYGGPIIERERIDLKYLGNPGDRRWEADAWRTYVHEDGESRQEGPTALIAAMRAYVASKFGDEVEL